jgi:hypothetical protein
MTKDEALERKAENARELGLDYEPEPRMNLLCDCEARSVAECCCGAWYDSEQQTWIGLTDDEIFEIHKQVDSMQYLTFGRAVEAALRSKNT